VRGHVLSPTLSLGVDSQGSEVASSLIKACVVVAKRLPSELSPTCRDSGSIPSSVAQRGHLTGESYAEMPLESTDFPYDPDASQYYRMGFSDTI